MLDLTIQLHRTNELLDRIATALERLAGPDLPISYHLPKQSTLSDYRVVDSTLAGEQQEDIRQAAIAEFAATYRVLPNTPAFDKVVKEYEAAIKEKLGEERGGKFLEEMPWRKPKK